MERASNANNRIVALWDNAIAIMERYLESAHSGDALVSQDPKTLYESWRVFSSAIVCLKRIQEGHIQAVKEAARGKMSDADGGDGNLSEAFASRIESLLEDLRRSQRDDDEER